VNTLRKGDGDDDDDDDDDDDNNNNNNNNNTEFMHRLCIPFTPRLQIFLKNLGTTSKF
jgi:hypothetical protein